MFGLILISWPVAETQAEIPLVIEDAIQGKIVLTLPEYLRAGETQEISLGIEYDQDNNEGEPPAQLKLINRLEIGSLAISPKGEGHTLINPDSVAVFVWKIRNDYAGSNSGLVWLFEESADGERFLILGRKIELLTRDILGMTYPFARGLCIGGMVFSLILCVPFFFRRKFS